METRLATRAKVDNCDASHVLRSLVSPVTAFFFFTYYENMKNENIFLVDSNVPLCPSVKGVTKAVNHINDTLGPALIQSVSAEVYPFEKGMLQ